MCGRFVLNVDPSTLQQAFQLDSAPVVEPRYNIAPTQMANVITNDHPRALSLLRWGLVPSWSKDLSIASKMINARSETVEEKPSFRTAFKRRRCLIPVAGFYEWKTDQSGKTPLYIQLKDSPVFALAGLWEIWHDPNGSELRTFTILTTAANEFMQQFHDRMPVILSPEDYSLWLDSDDVPPQALRDLMRQFDPAAMTAYEVSKMVNKPNNDSPECIVPIAS
jgi:putative SOS response-associated peptidase YedK